MDFAEKSVLITGASGGMGKEIAKQLSKEGCKLALFARREEILKEIANELSQIDTFVPKLYLSVLHFFDSMLKNEDLEEIHKELQIYKENFKRVHSSRKMFFLDSH